MNDYCQGKSRDEETDDSLTMLTLVMIWLLIIIGLAIYFLWSLKMD